MAHNRSTAGFGTVDGERVCNDVRWLLQSAITASIGGRYEAGRGPEPQGPDQRLSEAAGPTVNTGTGDSLTTRWETLPTTLVS